MERKTRVDGSRTKEIWVNLDDFVSLDMLKIKKDILFLKEINYRVLTINEIPKDELYYFMQFSVLPIVNVNTNTFGLIISDPFKRIPEEILIKYQAEIYVVNKTICDNFITDNFIQRDYPLEELNKNSKDFIIEMFTKLEKLGASDLNLSWTRSGVIISYLIERVAFKKHEDIISLEFAEKIKTTLVNMASENNANGFIDGKFVLHILSDLKDYRLSVMKTGAGHTIATRSNQTFDLSKEVKDLGYTARVIEIIYDIIINNPYGLFLITGKTASGKTTTMYTILNELYKKYNYRIKTAENPIELEISGIDQCQINLKGEEKNWVTYSKLLSGFLRQTPDIIGIAEIRDKDVAMSAIEAALTGHNVFSTLHTGNVQSTFTRLIKTMNISEDRIEDCMSGILCQTLVPQLCHCKEEDEDHAGGFKASKKGCVDCKYTGFNKDRIPATEIASLKKGDENYKSENYKMYYSFKNCADELFNLGKIDYKTKKYIYML